MLPDKQSQLIRDGFSIEKNALDAQGSALDDEINTLIEAATSQSTHEIKIMGNNFEHAFEQIDLDRQVAEAKNRGAVELAENYPTITRHLHAIHMDERRLSLMSYIYFLFRGH